MNRAASCFQLCGSSGQKSSQVSASGSSTSSYHALGSSPGRRQIILLEDLPNILHQPTQEAFQNSLESFVTCAQGVPLVIVISDATTRGEVRDERLAQGGGGRWSSRDTVDIRTVLPSSMLNGPYVTQIM